MSVAYNTTLAVDRAWEKTKENVAFGAKEVLAAAGTAAAAGGLLKYIPADKFESAAACIEGNGAKFLKWTAKLAPEKWVPKITGCIDSAASFIKKIPGPAKALATVLAVGGIVMHNISKNHNYKKGQIDQKFDMLERQQQFIV